MPSITAEHINHLLDSSSWPKFEEIEVQHDLVQARAFVPSTLSYFAGHFPEQAVLPGVVQVHWAGELAQRLFDVTGFTDLKSVKFNSMILPEQHINLELKYSAEKGTVRFSYSNGDDKFSSGMLSFSKAATSTQPPANSET